MDRTTRKSFRTNLERDKSVNIGEKSQNSGKSSDLVYIASWALVGQHVEDSLAASLGWTLGRLQGKEGGDERETEE